MRATRAYIAGIGTSGVLLVFAALLLIVLGALLGFRGWPGGSTAQDVDTLVIEASDRPLSIARVAADDRDAEGARSARAADADLGTAGRDGVLSPGSGIPLTGSTGATGGDRVGGGEDGSPIGPREVAPSAAPITPPPGDPASFGPPPINPRAGISPITDGLGGTTQGLSQGLGLRVEALSPPLGGVVQGGGVVVGGGLIDFGNVVDGSLPPVDQAPLPLPLPLPAPLPSR